MILWVSRLTITSLKGSSYETVSKLRRAHSNHDETHLEGNKHHTSNAVADQEQVFQSPDGGNVDADVEESHPDQPLIKFERSDEDLLIVNKTNCGL